MRDARRYLRLSVSISFRLDADSLRYGKVAYRTVAALRTLVDLPSISVHRPTLSGLGLRWFGCRPVCAAGGQAGMSIATCQGQSACDWTQIESLRYGEYGCLPDT